MSILTPSNRQALNTFMSQFTKSLFDQDTIKIKSLNYNDIIDSYLLFTNQTQKKAQSNISLEFIRINDVPYLWDARTNNVYDYKSKEMVGFYDTETGILCHKP